MLGGCGDKSWKPLQVLFIEVCGGDDDDGPEETEASQSGAREQAA